MFSKLTIQERFFLFLSITLMASYGYQCYFNYKIEKDINLAIESNNISVVRYTEINNNLYSATKHWRSLYFASTVTNAQLEKQIDIVNNYWEKEHMKAKQELFNLKNKSQKK